jgi:hypothetical protein
MASYLRLMVQFAATIGMAAMLSAVAPAVAAESTVTARESAATTVKTAPAVITHRASRRTRIAGSHYHRNDGRVSPMHSNLDCSGVWCGRQFVLMIGIGY